MIISRRERTSSFSVDNTPMVVAFSNIDSIELIVKVAASCKSIEATEFFRLSLVDIIFIICFSIASLSKLAFVIVMNKLLSTSLFVSSSFLTSTFPLITISEMPLRM